MDCPKLLPAGMPSCVSLKGGRITRAREGCAKEGDNPSSVRFMKACAVPSDSTINAMLSPLAMEVATSPCRFSVVVCSLTSLAVRV